MMWPNFALQRTRRELVIAGPGRHGVGMTRECDRQTKSRRDRWSCRCVFTWGWWLGVLWFCGAALGAEEVRAYDYKAFDTNGVLRVSGVVTLRLDDPVKIKGDWKLQVLQRDKLKEAGPQDGVGKISGYAKEDGVFLNLNPDQLHNNIYLDGKGASANNLEIKGKWGYYGFVGKLNEGNFEMVRKADPPK